MKWIFQLWVSLFSLKLVFDCFLICAVYAEALLACDGNRFSLIMIRPANTLLGLPCAVPPRRTSADATRSDTTYVARIVGDDTCRSARDSTHATCAVRGPRPAQASSARIASRPAGPGARGARRGGRARARWGRRAARRWSRRGAQAPDRSRQARAARAGPRG